MIIGFIVILIAIAGISNAVMDTLTYHYNVSIFSKLKNQQWFNPNLSWENKYKNGNEDEGPRFWGSTTYFVWVTDCWHFAKSVMFLCYELVILILLYIYLPGNLPIPMWLILLLTLIILKVLRGGFFELFWGNILKK